MTNAKRETTFPTRGEYRDPWELQELSELAGIRQHVAAFDVRTQVIAVEWQREQKRERRRRQRERARVRKRTHDSRPG